MSKVLATIFILLTLNEAHAVDAYMIELSTWIEYAGLVDQLRVDLCNKSESVCTGVKTLRTVGDELFTDKLTAALDGEPRLTNESELILRWGYFKETKDHMEALITARVGLKLAEIRQGQMNYIDFLDGTYISKASCRHNYTVKTVVPARMVGVVNGVGFITKFGCDRNE